MDVDDLLTEAQDLFFANNLVETSRICKDIIKSHPRESDAYSLLFLTHSHLRQYPEAVEVTRAWGKQCGYSLTQIRSLIESGYLADDTPAVLEGAQQLVSGRFKEPVGLFIKVLGAALCSDIGEVGMCGSLLDSCEGEEMDDEDESLVNIFSAWAEVRIGNDRRPYGLQSLEKAITDSNIHYRGFATALLALAHIDEGNLGEAENVITKADAAPDDANIAGVRALFTAARNGDVKGVEHLRCVDMALKGGNLLVKRRIAKLVNRNSDPAPSR
jgi:hypothetical protein